VEDFVNCPSSFPLRRRHALAAALFLVSPAISSAQDLAAGSYRELETKYIFGFTEGSDIGPEGERAIEFDSNLAFQKRQGVYNALEQEIEYETNPTQDLQIEASAHGVYHQIRGVDGFDDFQGANFGGLSANFRYNLIGRGPGAPVGLTFSVEPEWSRVNDAGKVNTSFGATAKIIADTELVPDRLFAAVNAIYAPEVSRDFGNPDWMKASTLGLTTALTCRIAPEVTLGGELEYYRANDSFWLVNFAGHALYAGPTLFVQMTNKILLAAAFSTQIAGHAAGDQNPLSKARLLVEIEF
jgi:hypothetical protein